MNNEIQIPVNSTSSGHFACRNSSFNNFFPLMKKDNFQAQRFLMGKKKEHDEEPVLIEIRK